jgi:hypothetical protein
MRFLLDAITRKRLIQYGIQMSSKTEQNEGYLETLYHSAQYSVGVYSQSDYFLYCILQICFSDP